MNEINVPDPWAGAPEINVDDGASFKSGYDTANTFTLTGTSISLPKTVGCWKISGNFHVYVQKRPNRLNRAMAKLLLGWEWVDL